VSLRDFYVNRANALGYRTLKATYLVEISFIWLRLVISIIFYLKANS